MIKNDSKLFPHLTKEVVYGIKGVKLESYLTALEGWRRGLTLKWQDEKHFSLTSKNRIHYFFMSRGDLVSTNAVRFCKDKEETKNLLKQAGVPTSKGEVFSIENQEGIISYAEKINYPVVIKPINGSMGKGVYINLNSKEELLNAMIDAQNTYQFKEYLVEKFYPGKEYRIYVVGDQAIVATNRIPANITGDGVSSVRTLIKRKNKERKKNPYLSAKPIKMDYEVQKYLKKLGYNEESVPKKGETVFLRENSNLSSGGDPIETTDELSKEIKQLAVNALKALPSIPHAGVDVIVDPNSHKKGVVIEINATAEISFHCFPIKGEAKDVPRAIIDYYFPETIGKEKSNLYFDYKSITEPLKTGTAEEITVSKPLIGYLYAKKYIVFGTVSKVGYTNWVKKQALKENLIGYTKKIEENTMEVFIAGINKKEVEKFGYICRKGSKRSKIEKVEEIEVELNRPFKNGFELF